jgi:hypothetical protein
MARDMDQAVECLPSKHKFPNSHLSTSKKEEKERKKKKNLVKVMGWINSKDKSNPG